MVDVHICVCLGEGGGGGVGGGGWSALGKGGLYFMYFVKNVLGPTGNYLEPSISR